MTTSHGQGDPRTKLSSRKPHAGYWPPRDPPRKPAIRSTNALALVGAHARDRIFDLDIATL
jgi:hypothetical protein